MDAFNRAVRQSYAGMTLTLSRFVFVPATVQTHYQPVAHQLIRTAPLEVSYVLNTGRIGVYRRKPAAQQKGA